jgi:tetratricopeptide (TPR) repeat protein
VGREKELAQLRQHVQPGKIVTLYGPGGIGKTALSRMALNDPEILARFPDGFLIHPFYQERSAEQVWGRIARECGLDPRTDARLVATQALAQRRLLLVLDGAEAADDLRAVVQVRGAQCGLLITSQNRGHRWDKRIEVKPLPDDEARELLERWADLSLEDETARTLQKSLGNLPLALRLVGRYLDATGMSAAEYMQLPESEQMRVLDARDFPDRSVMLVLSQTLNRLNQASKDAWALIGILALAPFDGQEVIVALGKEGGTALRQLVQFGLVIREEEGYSVSHALIHRYAHQFLPVLPVTVAQLAEYYTHLARWEGERGLAGYPESEKVRPHLLACLEACTRVEAWQKSVDLVWSMATVDGFLSIRGYWRDWQTALKQGIASAQRLKQRHDEGAFLNHLGLAYAALGAIETAVSYYRQALAIAHVIGDKRGEGNQLGNLGNAYATLGEVEIAITYHQQALAISREINDKWAQGQDLGNLGSAYYQLGEMETAVAYCQRALTIARNIGDKLSEGIILGNLGIVYMALGEVKKAKSHYKQALFIAESIGDRIDAVRHAWNLGLLLEDEDPAQAITLMSRFVDYEEEIGHPDAADHAKRVTAIRRQINQNPS